MSIKVFAPATVANVACGFDIFGFALNEPGDEVVVRHSDTLKISKITGDQGMLSTNPEKNVASTCIRALCQHLQVSDAFDIEIHKKMPIGSGLGSSAASAVAAVFAANLLLGEPFSRPDLLPFAMEGERIACGTAHADNVAPSLFGGFTLIRSYEPLEVLSIPINLSLWCTIIYPHVEVLTQQAREILPKNVSLNAMTAQTGNAAGLIVGLMAGDSNIVKNSLTDHIIEKVRAPLIPGFHEMQSAALDNGALGCSISGSGPSIFAITTDEISAKTVGDALKKSCPVESTLYLSPINQTGPKVI